MSDPVIVAMVMVPASVAAMAQASSGDILKVAWITLPTTFAAVVLTWWNGRIAAKAQALDAKTRADEAAAAAKATAKAAAVEMAEIKHTVNSQLTAEKALVETKSRIIEMKDIEIAGLRETIAMAAKMQTITESAPAILVENPPIPAKRKRKRTR